MRLRLDHLAVAATRLEDGVAFVEQALGVAPTGGGTHAAMGTHNRLLGLGELYLEVIAIDPAAPAPGRPRWFDLDRFQGPPRLTTWVVACDDLAAVLQAGPPGWGAPMALSRGDYRWQMAVPGDGVLPFDGLCPALIRWEGDLHPARALPDSGLRLGQLTLTHPRAAALQSALAALSDPRVVFVEGPAPALAASIDTPRGPVTLC
jgi:hypothetical protein